MSSPDTVLTKRVLTDVRSLLTKKEREEERKFIIEGWKSVEEAVNAKVKIHSVLYDPLKVEDHKFLSRLERSSGHMYQAKEKELESISDTVSSQGIIAVVPHFDHADALRSALRRPSALIVVLDGINDPGNLGTIIRTCDWFGVDAVLIGKHSVDLYNPKTVRATMGSLFHLPVVAEVELTPLLLMCKEHDCAVYSTELSKSVDIRSTRFEKKSVIIIGSESHGVSDPVSAMADHRIKIPQFGKAESLNAAMACGVILSHIRL